MDRKKILEMFQPEDNFLVGNLLDDIELAKEIEYPVYSREFYNPSIWKKFEELKNYLNIEIQTLGLTSESEKRILCFYPQKTEFEFLFPVKFFKIDGTNKFKTLEHKDFLGTIMSLGIKRMLLGDIIVENNIAYLVSFDNIYELISKNIELVGKIPVKIFEIAKEEIPALKFIIKEDTVTSLRLDNILCAITNCSRGDASNYIENGDVQVNFSVEKNKSKIIDEGASIVIRGKGKFIFEKIIGENKKGKFRIIIKKYI